MMPIFHICCMILIKREQVIWSTQNLWESQQFPLFSTYIDSRNVNKKLLYYANFPFMLYDSDKTRAGNMIHPEFILIPEIYSIFNIWKVLEMLIRSSSIMPLFLCCVILIIREEVVWNSKSHKSWEFLLFLNIIVLRDLNVCLL